jgi:hypothetical protein
MAVEFGTGPLVVADAAGRQQQGSLVARFGFGRGGVRVRGENFETVQVRLSPVVARAVLGASPADLDGAPVALDDLWGREESWIREPAESGYVDQSHLHREVKTFTGLTPTAMAVAPWLAIDDVAWPAWPPTRNPSGVSRPLHGVRSRGCRAG